MNSITYDPLDIAVIGMACRVPGANNPAEFWENIITGVESVQEFSENELREKGVSPELLQNPHYVKTAILLEGFDEFDAPFFDIQPAEAEILDPQRRLFLEQSWEALEDAGIVPFSYPGEIGVFAGIGFNIYGVSSLFNNKKVRERFSNFQLVQNCDKDYAALQLAYKLNLQGPSMNIQTACSSSLVAIHTARQSLLTGECEAALAGGAFIDYSHQGYVYKEGTVLSPDGHCRAFDEKSKGTVFGSGCGVVVLKKLAKALEDNDPIRAVIKGSAVTNEGSLKMDFNAPGVDGQAEVVAIAQANGDCRADSIGYVETHGTGTALGDPIEIESLTQAFREDTDKKQFCAIGSVKPNIGHLYTASGVISFIKTVLILEHKLIPGLTNFTSPNRKIDFVNSPFYIPAHPVPWKNQAGLYRAGVSSFGGTNAHVILQSFDRHEQHEQPEKEPPGELYVFPVSGRNDSVVKKAVERLTEYVEKNPQAELARIACTLQTGRFFFEKRVVFTARTREELIESLKTGTSLKPGPAGTSGEDQLLYALRWLEGEDPRWDELYNGKLYNGKKVRRTGLPAYPFEHKRYWIEPDNEPAEKTQTAPQESRSARREVKTEYAEPVTSLEKKLARIWEELLKTSPVGRNDTFLELGGTSLLVLPLAGALHKQLAVDLPLSQIIRLETIAELAAYITGLKEKEEKEKE